MPFPHCGKGIFLKLELPANNVNTFYNMNIYHYFTTSPPPFLTLVTYIYSKRVSPH